MPVVFIHGVTVREARYEALLQDFTDRIWEKREGTNVTGVYWGDLASTLRFKGASIPGFIAGTPAFKGVNDDRIDLVLALLQDPQYELSLLTPPPDPNATPPHLRPASQRTVRLDTARPAIVDELETLVPEMVKDARVTKPELDELVRDSFNAAKNTLSTYTAMQLVGPLARSLTAGLYRLVVDPIDLDPDFRWSRVEDEVRDLLMRHLKAMGAFTDMLATGVTFALERGVRRKLMAALSIFVGDVAKYMRHRDEILGRVEGTLTEVCDGTDELWLVGHSLGGVIAYEYCQLGRRQVDRLVTVGSQVGLLAEMGAVDTSNGTGSKFAMPPRTTLWLNLFDASDMLSFLANPVFEDVQDIPIDTRAPFPASHSEYWVVDAVYTSLMQDV